MKNINFLFILEMFSFKRVEFTMEVYFSIVFSMNLSDFDK